MWKTHVREVGLERRIEESWIKGGQRTRGSNTKSSRQVQIKIDGGLEKGRGGHLLLYMTS